MNEEADARAVNAQPWEPPPGMGKVHSHIHQARLEDINNIFTNLRAGTVDGRMVIMM